MSTSCGMLEPRWRGRVSDHGGTACFGSPGHLTVAAFGSRLDTSEWTKNPAASSSPGKNTRRPCPAAGSSLPLASLVRDSPSIRITLLLLATTSTHKPHTRPSLHLRPTRPPPPPIIISHVTRGACGPVGRQQQAGDLGSINGPRQQQKRVADRQPRRRRAGRPAGRWSSADDDGSSSTARGRKTETTAVVVVAVAPAREVKEQQQTARRRRRRRGGGGKKAALVPGTRHSKRAALAGKSNRRAPPHTHDRTRRGLRRCCCCICLLSAPYRQVV